MEVEEKLMDASMEIPQLKEAAFRDTGGPRVEGARRRNLLMEILLRLGSPTTLVHAALVCKRWLCEASGREFLSRFRKRNPPSLLGFYYLDKLCRAPLFFPMPPHPPELAGVISRASFRLDPYWVMARSGFSCCRNGRVHIMHPKTTKLDVVGVHSPLLGPGRGLVHLPSFPKPTAGCETLSQLIYNEDGEAICLQIEFAIAKEERPECLVHVDRLQKQNGDTSWCRILTLAVPELCHMHYERIVLSDDKIYIPCAQSDIVVLDLKVTTISTIQLPPGLQYGRGLGDIEFAPADDASGLYLIHAKELQLHIWLHKGDTWLLVDKIYLRSMVADLRMSGCNIEDELSSPFRVDHLGNYAEFVFLEMGGCTLHLDIKCRQFRKIKDGLFRSEIHPFLMIWPPTFPALKDYPARNAM